VLGEKKRGDDWKTRHQFIGSIPVSSKKLRERSATDAFFDVVGAMVPSCGPALRMVELGQKRPLSLKERFVLTYNSTLCPHCNCNRRKFNEERLKLREIEAERRKSTGKRCD